MWQIQKLRIALALTLLFGLLLMFGSLMHHLLSLGPVEVEYSAGKTRFQIAPRKPTVVAILCAWMKPEFSRADWGFSILGFLIVACSAVGLVIAYSGYQIKRMVFLAIAALGILSHFYILKIWLRNSGFYPTYTSPYYTCLAFEIIALIGFTIASRGLNVHVAKSEVAKVLIQCGLVCAVMAVPASRWGYVREPFRSNNQLEYQHDVVSLSFTIGLYAASMFLCMAGAAAIVMAHFYGRPMSAPEVFVIPGDTNPYYVHGSNVVHVDGY